MLCVAVTAASVSDQAGARAVFKRMRGMREKLRKVWVDGTYRGADWCQWDRAAIQNCFGVGQFSNRAKRFCGTAASVGGGENFCVVEPMSKIE